MMALPFLTQADAQQRLRDDGLLALGLTAVILSPRWAGADVTVDTVALTYTTTTDVMAPFTGLRRQLDELAREGLFDVDGNPIVGPGTRFDLHPQAAARLATLVAGQLGSAAGAIRPVPRTLVVRASTGTFTDQWFAAAADIADAGTCSFHDERGLIICPVAVAALFDALATALPALAPGWPVTADGGVADIATKATGTLVHVVDPHGAAFAPPGTETVVVHDSGGAQVAALGGGGLVAVDGVAGQTVGFSTAPTPPARLRLGWYRNATLGTVPLAIPALPGGVTLGRQFLRAVAVDLPWHLLGNRTAAAVQGVPPDDLRVPAEFHPQVRDQVNVDFLVDGVDVLAAARGVLDGFLTAGQGLVFAVSPAIEDAVGTPPALAAGSPSPDPATHWPQFPAPPAPGPAPSGSPAAGLTAVWSGDQDVVLTIAAGTVAVGASVRVFPQVFQVISSIGPEPSFLRGDGATVVVPDANPVSVLLRNPLRLASGDVRPAGARLVVDLGVTQRSGFRRIFANASVPIGAGAPPVVTDQFAAPDSLAVVPAPVRAIAPSPVFGIPAPSGGAPPGGGGSLVDLLRSLAGETTPRRAPRLPTMARFPTLVVAATGPTTGPMPWSAVVSGGWWARETRSCGHRLANPGNPAGPDVHAPGVRVDGALGFDAANIAVRRVQPIVPFDDDDVDGWVPFVATPGWTPPVAGTAPAPATCSGAVLRTLAVGVETPELLPSAVPEPAPGATAQSLVNDLAALLGVPAPTITIADEAQIVREIRREFTATRQGSRDALWSLRRAVGQARRLVFVVSPQLAATARVEVGETAAAHELDLVDVLADQLTAQRSLRVVIATPRLPDHVPAYGGWVREALQARAEAVAALRAVDPARVAVFHPVGFPGRDVRIRTTTVVVDDTYALVGTSHWRRRGMTFDEGVDVVSIDRAFDGTGASARIRRFRRALMAQLLDVPVPVPPQRPPADWVRFGSPISAADVVADLVAQGGLGRLLPFWPGPSDTDVLPQSHTVADPDGASSDQYLTLFAGLIGESP
jgi:hypothetical protein